MEMKIVFGSGKKVDAHFGGFTIMTDQSPEGGGEGSAPEPFDLFLASLGTCAGIYVLSFCQNRNLPSDGITLVQNAQRNSETGMIEKLNIDIQIPESFPEKYHAALVRSAEQCTVKKHVSSGLPEFSITASVL